MENENEFQSTSSESKNHIWAIVAALILLAIILFGGYYLVKNLKKPKIEPKPTINEPWKLDVINVPSPKEPEAKPEIKKEIVKEEPIIKAPDLVVEDFYNWYKDQGENALEEEGLKSQGSLSMELLQKLKNNSNEIDPILCTKGKPSSLETEPAKINGENASVVVNENFFGDVKSVKVNLKKMENEWKIIAITCLSEEGVRGILENLKSELNLDYATVKDVNLIWSVPDYKGLKDITYKGMGFSVKNATADTSILKKFFEKNQFKKNLNNTNSYEKDKTMCIISDEINGEKHDLSVTCAEK